MGNKVWDVCSLGSCSRFWEEVCGIDFVWECLSRERWPDVDLDKEFLAYEDQRHELDQSIQPSKKGWRAFYKMKHEDMSRKANLIVEYLRQQESSYESVDVGDYIKAIQDLQAMHFSFKDVQMLLFKPKFNVVVNLVALHYCMVQLCLPAEDVVEALSSSNIEKRQVCVQWKRLRGRLGLFGGLHRSQVDNCCLEYFAWRVDRFALLQSFARSRSIQIQISAAAT